MAIDPFSWLLGGVLVYEYLTTDDCELCDSGTKGVTACCKRAMCKPCASKHIKKGWGKPKYNCPLCPRSIKLDGNNKHIIS